MSRCVCDINTSNRQSPTNFHERHGHGKGDKCPTNDRFLSELNNRIHNAKTPMYISKKGVKSNERHRVTSSVGLVCRNCLVNKSIQHRCKCDPFGTVNNDRTEWETILDQRIHSSTHRFPARL